MLAWMAVQEDAIRSTRYVVTHGMPEQQLPDMSYLQECHSTMQVWQ